MKRLEGKVALITGGARGMGASHAKMFIEEGAKVIISDILEKEGQEMAASLGDHALFVRHDVTKAHDWEKVVEEAEKKFGPINVLVNNAGIALFNSIDLMSEEDFDKVYNINQKSIFLGVKAVLPSMKKANEGSIINISSISGLVGQPGGVAYNGTKFAVTGMTKALALELGHYNIRVNSVHPGVIDTPMTQTPEIQETIKPMIAALAIKRSAKPHEISHLCVFLASDESSYSTGTEFVADGGLIAQ